jgi:hypothetical protein
VVVVCEDITWIRAIEIVFQRQIMRALNQMNTRQQERHQGRATPHEFVRGAAHALVQVDCREGFDRTGGDHASPSRPGAQQGMGDGIHLDAGAAVVQEMFCSHAIK